MKNIALVLYGLAATAALVLFMAVTAPGCAITRTFRSDTPAGTTHASYESYAGGLVVREDTVTTSRDDYRRCLDDRRTSGMHLLGIDDQASCYRQTVPAYDPRGSAPVVTVPVFYGGYGGYGSPYYMGYFGTNGAPVRW
jgi:hypothetical protein